MNGRNVDIEQHGNPSLGQAGIVFQQIQYLCLPLSQVDWTTYWTTFWTTYWTTYCVIRFLFDFIFDTQLVFQKTWVSDKGCLQ